ncbi:hypothetical protein BW897_21015 [Bacillus cereus]|uniref:Uncharacterized protein n=1 Tax=Bacillus cereus TaxID=1396 RepID=A0A1S9TLN8_BACCE|nr:hypothetical protein [Bacillus cereus]OOR10842.1 hypothetical protein BW897_21015 [Bacillus cereus]
MDKQSKKEDSLQKKKDLDDILEDLVAAFPEGCFCPPTPATVAQIETALNALLVWSTSAPISSSLKMKLQDAINDVKDLLDAEPFSCCDTIQALQALEVVLSKVVDQPLVGIPFKVHLLNLLQQLQALFAGYIACVACEPGLAYSFSEPVSIFTTPAVQTITNVEGSITTVSINITQPSLIELRGLVGWSSLSASNSSDGIQVIWRIRRGISGPIIWEGHDGVSYHAGDFRGQTTSVLHIDNAATIGTNIYQLTATILPIFDPTESAEINGPIVLAATGYPV